MKKARIRVEVSPGTFSSERFVNFLAGGKHYSMVVDAHDVSDGTMQVSVLAEYSGEVLVDLPRETVTTGPRVRLPKDCLLA